MTTERTIGIVAIVLAVIAVVIGIVGLLAPTAQAPTEEGEPVADEGGQVADELVLASGDVISVTSIEPSPAEPVVLPFEIVMTTNIPVAAGISEGNCQSRTPGEPGLVFSALLALDQIPKQSVTRLPVNDVTITDASSYKSCEFTIFMQGQSSSLQQQVTYEFAE